MKYKNVEYIIVFLAILASISMIRLEPTPYSTDEMNYKDTVKLLSKGKISTEEFTHAFIKINSTYYPSQPIGYPIISLPIYLLFNLENELLNNQPRFYFSPSFYPPETDDRGTFYWLESNGTIYVYSKSNNLIRFGFFGISFVEDREVNIFFQNEDIFNKKISIYPKWYETYFPARKGWNELNINAGKCYSISKIKGTDDDRCVSLMLLNPKFDSFVAEPRVERTESYIFSGNETFVVNAVNPNIFPVKVKINFIVKSNLNSTLILRVEDKKYNFDISTYPMEIFTDFVLLKPNQTRIGFEVNNCKNCFITFNKIKFYLEKDFYDEDFVYKKGIYLEETLGNKKWRWVSNNATIFSHKNVLEFYIWSYEKPRLLKIMSDGKFLKEISLSTVPNKFKIQIPNSLSNVDFISDDCSVPRIVENNTDYRCLSFGISKG